MSRSRKHSKEDIVSSLNSFSNLEKMLGEKDLLINSLREQLQDYEMQFKTQNEFLLEKIKIGDVIPTYDELYTKLIETFNTQSDLSLQLETLKSTAIETVIEKETRIQELEQKLSEHMENEQQSMNLVNQEIEMHRKFSSKLEGMEEAIKNESLKQKEQEKKMESQIYQEVNKKMEEERGKWLEKEKELLDELGRKDEENFGLAKKVKEMEKINSSIQGRMSKEIEDYDKQLMVLSTRKLGESEIMKLDNKYQNQIISLQKEIEKTQKELEKERRDHLEEVELERNKYKQELEIKENEMKKAESLKIIVNELNKDLSIRTKELEEISLNFSNKMKEMKEQHQIVKDALELENKKLKQEEEYIRRRSTIIMKPLLHELSFMSPSQKLSAFSSFLPLKEENEEESQQSEEDEMQRLEDELNEAMRDLSELRFENEKLKKDIFSERQQHLSEKEKLEQEKEELLLQLTIKNGQGLDQSIENADLYKDDESLFGEIENFNEKIADLNLKLNSEQNGNLHNSTLEEKISELIELKLLLEEKNRELMKKNQEIEQIKGKLYNLENNFESLRGLKRDLVEMRDVNEKIEREKSEIICKMQELEEEKGRILKDLEKMGREREEILKSIEILGKKKREVMEKMEMFESEKGEIIKKLEGLEKEKKDILDSVERFKSELEASKEQILSFIQKQILYEKEKGLMREKLDEIEKEINKLTTDKQNLLSKVEHLNNTLSLKENEFIDEKKENEKRLKEIEEKLFLLEKEKSSLLMKIKFSEENIEKSKKEIEKLLNDKQAVQLELDAQSKLLIEINEKMIALEKERITLIETIRTNKKKIEKLSKEKGEATMEKDKFKCDNELLNKLISELREKLNFKKKSKTSINEKIKSKDSELEKSNKEKNELIELKNKLTQELENLNKNIDSANCTINDLNNVISNLEKEKSDLAETMKEQLAIKNNEIEKISEEKIKMAEALETLLSHKKDLLLKVDELNNEVISIHDQLIKKQTELETLKNIKHGLEKEKNEIFNEKSKITASLLESSMMISKLEEEKTNIIYSTQEEMQKINFSTENGLKTLAEQLSLSNLENLQLKDDIANLNKAISELNERILLQDKEKMNFSEKLRTHSKKLDRLKSEKSETDLEKDKFMKETDRLKAELDKTSKLNFELRDKLNKKEKERSSLTDRLKQRETELDKLIKEKNEILSEKKRAVEELESLTSKKLAEIKERNIAKEEERIKLIDSLTQKNDLKNIQIENLKDEVKFLKEKFGTLQKEIEELLKEKELIEIKVGQLNQEIVQKDETIEFLNQHIKSQELAMERILLGNEEISNDVMERNRIFENRIKELSDLFEEKINTLQANLTQELKSKQSMMDENATLMEKVRNLNDSLSEISNRHERFKQESQQFIQSLEKDLKDQNDQLTELKREVGEHIRTNNKLNEQFEFVSGEIDCYKTENLNLKKSLESEIKEKTQIVSERNHLAEKMEKSCKELDLKVKEYRKLEEEYQLMFLEKNRENDFYKAMNAKLDDQVSHLKKIESQNNLLLEDLEKNQILINEKEDYIKNLKNSNQMLSTEQQKNFNNFESNQNELKLKQLEIKNSDDNLVFIKKENSILEEKVLNLRNASSSLNSEIKTFQIENSNLKKNLLESSQKYTQLKADFSNLHAEFNTSQKTKENMIKELNIKHQKQLEKMVLENMEIVKDRRSLNLEIEKLENEKKELSESNSLKLKQKELELDIMQLSVLEKDKEMARLQKQMKDMNEKANESEDRVRNVEKTSGEKIEENKCLQRRVDQLNNASEGIVEELKRNKKETDHLKEHRDSCQKRIFNVENLLSLKDNILTELNDKVDISIFFALGLKDNNDRNVVQNVYLEFLINELKEIKLFLEKSLPIKNIYSETHQLILENNILSKRIKSLSTAHEKQQEPKAKLHNENEKNNNILSLLTTPIKEEKKTFFNSSNKSFLSSEKNLSDFESYVFSEEESEVKFEILFEYLEHLGQKINKKINMQSFETGQQDLVLLTSEMMIDCNEIMKFYNENYKEFNKKDSNERITKSNIDLRRTIMEIRTEIFAGLKVLSNFIEKNQTNYEQVDLIKTPITLYHLYKRIVSSSISFPFPKPSLNMSLISSLYQKLIDFDSLYEKKFAIINESFMNLCKKFSLLTSKLNKLAIQKKPQPKKDIPYLNLKNISPSLEEKLLPLIEQKCLIGINEFQGLKKQIKHFSKKIEKKFNLQTDPAQPESGLTFSSTPLKIANAHKYSRSEIFEPGHRSLFTLKPNENRKDKEGMKPNIKQKLKECLNSFATQPDSKFSSPREKREDSALTEKNYEKKDISVFDGERFFGFMKNKKGKQEQNEKIKNEKIKISINLEGSTIDSKKTRLIGSQEQKIKPIFENAFLKNCINQGLSQNSAGSLDCKNFSKKYQGYSQCLLGQRNKRESVDFRDISSFEQNWRTSSNFCGENEFIKEWERMMEEINLKNKIIEDLKREKNEQQNLHGIRMKESMNTSNQLYFIPNDSESSFLRVQINRMNNRILSLTQQNDGFKKSLQSYEQETKQILEDLKSKCDQLHKYEIQISEAKNFMEALKKLLIDEDFYVTNNSSLMGKKYKELVERIHLMKFEKEFDF